MEKLCKKVPLLPASLIYPFPHAPPYLWPTASTVCNFYANFFLQETNAEKRERVKERKGAKKWFFEIPPPLPLPSLAFLPFDHSIFASTRLLFFHTIPPSLPRSYLPRGSFHSMEFQSCPWRRLATRASPIFHSALHKERRPIGI